MFRLERAANQQDMMIAAFAGLQSGLWTALPGIIQSFDATKQTAVVQVAIQLSAQNQDGSSSWVTIAPLLDCPVFFPSGGGFSLTFPVAAGDECLMVFASRCIDQWWNSGAVSIQAEFRMHDISDGFALVGFASVPKVIPSVSTTTVQLRNKAGTTYVEVDGSGNINVKAANVVTIQAATINLNGTLNINGAPYLTHHHSGVSVGGSNTGNVV